MTPTWVRLLRSTGIVVAIALLYLFVLSRGRWL